MFLDDNISFAKKWKGILLYFDLIIKQLHLIKFILLYLNIGEVTFEVLDDQLPRGFLIERFLQDATEGQSIFFKMVKNALELKKLLPCNIKNLSI